MEQVKKAAIVLAAGHGKRMHSKVAKQYLLLNGEPVLVHALRAFEMSGMDTIILVTGRTRWNSAGRISWRPMGFPA